MISGPQYLNSIEGILLRWRMAHKVAHGDIRHCYQKIQSDPHDMSLRRIVIKPNGMGSEEDNWKEVCFKTVSFGDGLGGSWAKLAIEDCSFRFMGVNTRRDLSDSIYMDDICLPLYDPAGDLSKMLK